MSTAHGTLDQKVDQKSTDQKTLLLLKPRGFCAGVVRAIDIVRIALEKFGPPIYVRKEIVHNRYVVEELQQKGAIFVDSVEEVVNLTAGEIEPTPEFGTRIDTSYLLGMAKVKGQVKTLLDIDRVVAPDTVQAMVQAV